MYRWIDIFMIMVVVYKTRKQKWEETQLYGYFKGQTSKISDEKT